MSYRIVASCDAQWYQAWQVWTLAHSVRSRLGTTIDVVLHSHEHGEDPLFKRLEEAGHRIVRVPTYKWHPAGGEYPPRNAPGSLLHAPLDSDAVVLFDPDMVVVAPFEVPSGLAAVDTDTLNWQLPFVMRACRQYQVDVTVCSSVIAPYVIPTALAPEFARTWLEAVDVFTGPWVGEVWQVSMYAFSMAAQRLALDVERVPLAQMNHRPDDAVEAPVLHYCYSTPKLDKRAYVQTTARQVWSLMPATPGTVAGEVTALIREATPA